jgi:type II secretory pathway pseudopilin PulG
LFETRCQHEYSKEVRAMRRRAYSLTELLVIIAIITISTGLFLTAVQKSRESGLKAKSMNNLRQIMTALHAYTANHDGRLPTIVDVMKTDGEDRPPFYAILPYLEGRRDTFISPADPSLNYTPKQLGYFPFEGNHYSSYGYNAIAFTGRATLQASIPDGTSGTIAVGEHYARCARENWPVFIYSLRISMGDFGPHRPSFADKYYGDVLPLTRGNPPSTVSTSTNRTFQTAPALDDSDATVLQTPHRSGMLTAYFDGSVRTTAPAVAENVFWSAVTPAGRESVPAPD